MHELLFVENGDTMIYNTKPTASAPLEAQHYRDPNKPGRSCRDHRYLLFQVMAQEFLLATFGTS